MYSIFLHPLADKFLKDSDKVVGEQIKKKLRELKEFPERGKPLKYTNFWSLRIGDYRAIYEIHKKENKIIVLFIGHRSNVYDDVSKLF
ncbi:MAG: type II toxin-antitoxin system RelE/ParE family toxin [Nanoarchaeota archaeon]|nr:type II toxin-antitoxin system RelE/ParE family toxin [Nanoarchaeota archaeon]MBU1135054.1 type II toxin-antitoxin system RelE/ParE family toxin [Nanoarchaeota archaeon]MBU2520291.1 type II toxin-antitoxin system RelE/ParE family toxin [Nanoarchaeota archaeon]